MKINKKFLFVIILFLSAIVINTIVHFTHPSYKYYKENVNLLNDELNNFKDKVVYTLVPSINTINTNLVYSILPNFESNLLNKIETNYIKSKIFNIQNQNVLVQNDNNLSKEIFVKDYQCMKANGYTYVRIFGNIYTVGDIICGEPILSIDNLVTSTKSYNFIHVNLKEKEHTNVNTRFLQ